MAKLDERYSKAMYELTVENNNFERAHKDALLIQETLNDESFIEYLAYPEVQRSQKKALLHRAFENHVEPIWLDFLDVIIDRRRGGLIPDILSSYIEKTHRALGNVTAKVVSARSLKQEQLDAIANALTQKTDLNIVFETEVDPEVIGGFYVMIDGQIFDSTIRNEINHLTEYLKRKGATNGR